MKAGMAMNQLMLDILHVTQEAALAASPWVGRGRKMEADDAATTAMRRVLQLIPMAGTVVIGEGSWMRRRCCISGKSWALARGRSWI